MALRWQEEKTKLISKAFCLCVCMSSAANTKTFARQELLEQSQRAMVVHVCKYALMKAFLLVVLFAFYMTLWIILLCLSNHILRFSFSTTQYSSVFPVILSNNLLFLVLVSFHLCITFVVLVIYEVSAHCTSCSPGLYSKSPTVASLLPHIDLLITTQVFVV